MKAGQAHCGISLRSIEDGRGELTLFFDSAASEETRFYFEDYVQTHLQRSALPQSIQRRRIFVCPTCATSLTDTQVTRRRERGYDWIECNVCNTRVSLLDREERLRVASTSVTQKIDISADNQREDEAAQSTLEGKIATSDFDVFLCHNNQDKPLVKEIGEKLKKKGILPWLDEWALRPGLPEQPLREQQIGRIKVAAVFIGDEGIEPWQQIELDAFLRESVRRGISVIPVLLPNATKQPKLPISLEGITQVDFRRQDPNPMRQLIWGITGNDDSINSSE